VTWLEEDECSHIRRTAFAQLYTYLCMCAYICIYIYIYVLYKYVYVYIHTHAHAYAGDMCSHFGRTAGRYIQLCYIFPQLCIYFPTCAYINTYLRAYDYIYIFTRICIYRMCDMTCRGQVLAYRTQCRQLSDTVQHLYGM